MGACMIVAPSSRAFSTVSTLFGSMCSCSITPLTASCNDPPSEVKSFWYSIRTTAVVLGSIFSPSQQVKEDCSTDTNSKWRDTPCSRRYREMHQHLHIINSH